MGSPPAGDSRTADGLPSSQEGDSQRPKAPSSQKGTYLEYTRPRGLRASSIVRPFAEAADVYLASGFSPIPVGQDKRPLVSGYHGRAGKRPSEEVVARWVTKYGDANIAIRLPEGMIGIDVDGYDGKAGAETLVEFEDELGAFPPTVISTARDDGISGIRLYRIPEGYEGVDWPGQLGPGVDIVTWYERYMIVSPSWHAGASAQYRWWLETDDGRMPLDGIGGILIPELPAKMADAIASSARSTERVIVEDVRAWLNEHRGDSCRQMARTLAHWVEEIHLATDGGGIHDTARDGSKALLGDCAAGHVGVWDALWKLRSVFLEAMDKRSRIRRADAVAEWQRMVTGAVGLAAAKPAITRDPCREMDELGEISPVRSYGDDTVWADDVVDEELEWLNHPWLPKGKLIIVDGDPGQGKSVMTAGWVARASFGGDILPVGRNYGHPIRCGLIIREDDEPIVVGRLRAAGYKFNRSVCFMKLRLKRRNGKVEPLTFPDGHDRVRSFVVKNGLGLVIIDPISSFIGEDVKTHNDASVRQALEPLKDIATDTGCTIVMVRHLNKSSDMKAMYRGGGSIAFSALARSGMITGQLPDGRYGLAHVKCSYAEKHPEVVTYSVVPWEENDSVAVIEWHDPEEMSADDLIAPKGKPGPKDTPVLDDVMAVLEEMFSSRDTWAAERAKAALKSAGVSANPVTVGKACKRLGIVKRRIFRPGMLGVENWIWTTVPEKFRADGRKVEE